MKRPVPLIQNQKILFKKPWMQHPKIEQLLLSTIQDADYIFVFRDGFVVEHGKHDELLTLRNIYFNMVQQQKLT
jgi:hypothetical protein